MKKALFVLVLIGGLLFSVLLIKDKLYVDSGQDIPAFKEITVGKEKVELEKKRILNNRVEILLPRGFSIMSEEKAKMKYPSERRPTLIYTNQDDTVNVVFDHTSTKISVGQLYEYKKNLRKTLESIYPSADWFDDKVIKIGGRDVGTLQLLTPAIDIKIYNSMFFTELDGKLLLASVNCTEEKMKDWKSAAREIMNSLRVVR